MAQVVEPLRAMLEERMSAASGWTTKVTSEWELPDHAWIDDRFRSWRVAQGLVARTVILYHTRPAFQVLIFTDESDARLGSFLAQVSRSKYHSGVPVKDS